LRLVPPSKKFVSGSATTLLCLLFPSKIRHEIAISITGSCVARSEWQIPVVAQAQQFQIIRISSSCSGSSAREAMSVVEIFLTLDLEAVCRLVYL
jgi:hypothetical protein